MKKSIHPVADHAVVRYLERVEGVDIDALRARIGRIVEEGVKHEASGVIAGGFVYKLTNGRVTTVWKHPRQEPGRKKRRGRRPRD